MVVARCRQHTWQSSLACRRAPSTPSTTSTTPDRLSCSRSLCQQRSPPMPGASNTRNHACVHSGCVQAFPGLSQQGFVACGRFSLGATAATAAGRHLHLRQGSPPLGRGQGKARGREGEGKRKHDSTRTMGWLVLVPSEAPQRALALATWHSQRTARRARALHRFRAMRAAHWHTNACMHCVKGTASRAPHACPLLFRPLSAQAAGARVRLAHRPPVPFLHSMWASYITLAPVAVAVRGWGLRGLWRSRESDSPEPCLPRPVCARPVLWVQIAVCPEPA